MKIERLLQRLREGAKGDRKSFASAGEQVGNELPRNRLNLLRLARAEVARLAPEVEGDGYAHGYTDALRDILVSYELAVAEKQDTPPDDVIALIRWREACTDRYGDDLISAMQAWFTRPELGIIERVPPKHQGALRKFQAVDYNTQIRALRKVLNEPEKKPKSGWNEFHDDP